MNEGKTKIVATHRARTDGVKKNRMKTRFFAQSFADGEIA